MAGSYGKYPKSGGRGKKSAPKQTKIQISFSGEIEPETFALSLWAELDKLKNEHGVVRLKNINIYATPVDESGQPATIHDRQTGEILERVPISNIIKSTTELLKATAAAAAQKLKGPS